MRNLLEPTQRVALVHDFLLDVRGAERVFLELCAMWPDADIYTAVYDEHGTEGRFADRRVHTSFLQRVRPSARNFRALLPLYPAAIESLDLSGYDVVISSSSAWAHGVRCEPSTVHVCYCHNPFRYAWNDCDQTLRRCRSPLSRAVLRTTLQRWRRWDVRAAQRLDRYVSNSATTQARIRTCFGRGASIVHPPVHTERFAAGPVGDRYVIVSELMAHKRIDVAIEAFNQLRRPLSVIGDGPAARHLRRLAAPNVEFLGRLPDADVAAALQQCRALVQTSVEEFGIAAVECQAAGRPVIAVRAGGALETVLDGVTGCFWAGGPRELAAAVVAFDDDEIDPKACVQNAARFDAAVFRRAMYAEVTKACAARAEGPGFEPRTLRPARFALRAGHDARR